MSLLLSPAQVKLTDSLMSGLAWRSAGDTELAWLSAVVTPRAHQRENTTTSAGNALVKPLVFQVSMGGGDCLPSEEATSDVSMCLEAAPGGAHAASFINSVRLSELRAALSKLGLTTEFTAGALECCNGTLAIRRLENGRVALEGVLSEEYYKVRELLYEQFAITLTANRKLLKANPPLTSVTGDHHGVQCVNCMIEKTNISKDIFANIAIK
uniref:Cleavage and polyadenylation specificity factor subunit 2 n=1 Tax=Spodoptera frugiperda TaxID=7108 RepID=A0A2H1V4R3_SPOFR